jgi:ABC-type nitrate/sulfonate/bicarbonate transport system permease component
MLTEIRAVPLNALLPILVTLLGMMTEARLGQFANAPLPILVTLLGMLTEVRAELINALLSILTTG